MERMQVTAYPLLIYSPGNKLPTSLKLGHLPQRFFLFCKHASCTAATFSALTLRRDSLLKLSLSSFFRPMSQGGFSPIHMMCTSVAMEVPLQQLQQSLCQILAMGMFI